MFWLVQKNWDSQLCTSNFLRHIHQKSSLHWLYSALHRLSTFCFYNSQRHFQVLVVLDHHLAADLIGMMKNQGNIAANLKNMVNINNSYYLLTYLLLVYLIELLTSEATPSTTQFFKSSYKISHPWVQLGCRRCRFRD